jgi:hypothetical protein
MYQAAQAGSNPNKPKKREQLAAYIAVSFAQLKKRLKAFRFQRVLADFHERRSRYGRHAAASCHRRYWQSHVGDWNKWYRRTSAQLLRVQAESVVRAAFVTARWAMECCSIRLNDLQPAPSHDTAQPHKHYLHTSQQINPKIWLPELWPCHTPCDILVVRGTTSNMKYSGMLGLLVYNDVPSWYPLLHR